MVEINDSHILMYLDGAVDADIKALIEEDENHLRRVQDLRDLQKNWSSRLYRSTCPDSLLLGEYHMDVLPIAQKKTIEMHLSSCRYCKGELAEMELFVQIKKANHQVTLVNQVETLIARLISGGKPTNAFRMAPALGLRGDMGGSYQYEAGTVKIAIDVLADVDAPGSEALIGIITGINAENYEVSLWQTGIKIGSAKIDELGGFTIGGLHAGEYQLIILGPKVEIQVQSFIV